jgi:biotin transport system substrate-specific component
MAISKPEQPTQIRIAFFKSLALSQNVTSFFQILFAACFMGVCAQIKIPLHFTPVPLTVQTTGVMLIGVFLGSRKGVYAILFYLIQGCLGLPVWAGGASGFLHFTGPTGGYLMASILQVAFIGWFLEKRRKTSFN